MYYSRITIEQIQQMNGFIILDILGEYALPSSVIMGRGRDTKVWSSYSLRDLRYMFNAGMNEDFIYLRDESQDEVIMFDRAKVVIKIEHIRETDEAY